jgi:MFS family permease
VTIPLITLLGLGVGAGIAITSRRAIVRELDPLRSRYLGTTALFAGAVLTPGGLALYLLFPDWSWMYFANPSHLAWYLVVPLLVFLYVGGAPVAFLITRRLLMLPRPRPLRIALACWIGLLLLILIGGGHRIANVSYYEAWHTGQPALPLVRSALFLPLIVICGATFAVLAFTWMHLRRHLVAAETPLNLRTSTGSSTAPLTG